MEYIVVLRVEGMCNEIYGTNGDHWNGVVGLQMRRRK